MAIGSPKIKTGDRVMHDGVPCAVVLTTPTKLTIRDQYGYKVEIKRKGAKLAK